MRGKCPQPGNRNGLVLITTLLFLLPLTLLLLVVHERVSHRVRVSHDLERQLYSLTLAANGVELVRALLPAMDLGEMLERRAGPVLQQGLRLRVGIQLPDRLPSLPLCQSWIRWYLSPHSRGLTTAVACGQPSVAVGYFIA